MLNPPALDSVYIKFTHRFSLKIFINKKPLSNKFRNFSRPLFIFKNKKNKLFSTYKQMVFICRKPRVQIVHKISTQIVLGYLCWTM